MKYEGAEREEEGGAEGEGREGWGTREGRGGMRDHALGHPALSRPHAVAEATGRPLFFTFPAALQPGSSPHSCLSH